MDITSYLLGKNSAGGGGGSDLDWTALGYEERPQAIDDAYNVALKIKNEWNSTSSLKTYQYEVVICPMVDTSAKTSFRYFAQNCYKLLQIPLLDTSNVTNMANAFNGCYSLTTIPALNTSKVTNVSSMFNNCYCLSDESLNNILAMCINATSYTGTKTLANIGISSTYYSVEKIQALSNYQAFIDAGWTIGY